MVWVGSGLPLVALFLLANYIYIYSQKEIFKKLKSAKFKKIIKIK
jgi:hypothetical protein